jgi:hypothetical protein
MAGRQSNEVGRGLFWETYVALMGRDRAFLCWLLLVLGAVEHT